MKVRFSRKVPFTPTWNGNLDLPEKEQLQAVLVPAKMGDLLDIVDAFSAVGETKIDTETADPKLMRQIVEACGGVLPKYVTIENLECDDGPLTLEEAIDYLNFTPLMVELLGKLADISTPDNKADEEN